jgi:hypothetical protein
MESMTERVIDAALDREFANKKLEGKLVMRGATSCPLF